MIQTAQLQMMQDTPNFEPANDTAQADLEEVVTDSQFAIFDLPEKLLSNLTKIGYTTPTPIQEQTIPLAMSGRDVLGTAQTGTGKTGGFAIPMLAKIMASPRGSALILLPTRELATQVKSVVDDMLGKRSFIPTVLLIGGEPMGPQTQRLRMRPRIVIGTPGRINDHLERGNMMLHDTNYFVLDETDRMLDMGFGPQIDKIIKFLPAGRQTLLFSATLPKEILKLSSKYLTNPERVEIGTVNTAMPQIQQEVIYVQSRNKYEELLKQLQTRTGSVIVFTNTKREADRTTQQLNKDGERSDAIHGDLNQHARKRVLKAFRDQKFRVLVATDIAARGLDVPHIEHVINFNLPMVPEDYIHRIGRTGRNGAKGESICLVAREDEIRWQAIHRMLNPGKPDLDLPGGGAGDRKKGGSKKPGNFKKRNNNSGKPFRSNRDGAASGESRGAPRGEFKGGAKGESKGARGEYKGGAESKGARGEFKAGPRGESKGGSRGEYKGGAKGESKGAPRGEFKAGPRGESKGGSRGDSKGGPRGEFKGGAKGGSKTGGKPSQNRRRFNKPSGPKKSSD